MTTLSIPIEERAKQDLQERAKRLGIRIEELALLSLKSLIFQESDEFTRTMQYLIAKNEELYRRLA